MLCASLAWRESKVLKLFEIQQNKVNSEQYNSDNKTNTIFSSKFTVTPTAFTKEAENINSVEEKVPTIMYTSRTHIQLTQVIKELKKTAYKPKTTILGSRDQLCTNSDLKKKGLVGKQLNQMCNNLVKNKRCVFKENLNSHIDVSRNEIMDIEDLLNYCTKNIV